MSGRRITADKLLASARKIVRERGKRRGAPYDNHQRIALLWSAFLDARQPGPLLPWEVAIMMQLLKIGRMLGGDYDPDHDLDNIGFGALAGELRKVLS